jgi:hypothetical protein
MPGAGDSAAEKVFSKKFRRVCIRTEPLAALSRNARTLLRVGQGFAPSISKCYEVIVDVRSWQLANDSIESRRVPRVRCRAPCAASDRRHESFIGGYGAGIIRGTLSIVDNDARNRIAAASLPPTLKQQLARLS